MALEDLVYATLHDDVTVSGIVGSRIYPKMLPQKQIYPALLYSKVSGGQQSSLQGYGGFDNPRYSVDVFTYTYAEVIALTSAVISAMTAATTFVAVIISDNDLTEEDEDIHHRGVDFSIWYNPNV